MTSTTSNLSYAAIMHLFTCSLFLVLIMLSLTLAYPTNSIRSNDQNPTTINSNTFERILRSYSNYLQSNGCKSSYCRTQDLLDSDYANSRLNDRHGPGKRSHGIDSHQKDDASTKQVLNQYPRSNDEYPRPINSNIFERMLRSYNNYLQSNGCKSSNCRTQDFLDSMYANSRLNDRRGPGKRSTSIDSHQKDDASTEQVLNQYPRKRTCSFRLGGHCLTEELDRAASTFYFLRSPDSPGKKRRSTTNPSATSVLQRSERALIDRNGYEQESTDRGMGEQ